MTGPQAVRRYIPDGVGHGVSETGSLLCDSSWIARSAAVMVPAPAQAPSKNHGVHLQDVIAEQQRHEMRQDRHNQRHEHQVRPGLAQTDTKVGPVFNPTIPMNTARPTVSKIQRAGSGILPKVGYTERSQPNTRPMMSAPPLVVRVRGSPPTVSAQQADETADDNAQAEEHDVRLARWTLEC